MIDEERLINIELKLTHQEDTVETLNRLVYLQQKKIDALEELLAALARQLKATASTLAERHHENEKPPHY